MLQIPGSLGVTCQTTVLGYTADTGAEHVQQENFRVPPGVWCIYCHSHCDTVLHSELLEALN